MNNISAKKQRAAQETELTTKKEKKTLEFDQILQTGHT